MRKLYRYDLKRSRLSVEEADLQVEQILKYDKRFYRLVRLEDQGVRLERYEKGRYKTVREDGASREAKLFANKDGLYYCVQRLDEKKSEQLVFKIYKLDKSEKRPIFSRRMGVFTDDIVFVDGDYSGKFKDIEGLVHVSADLYVPAREISKLNKKYAVSDVPKLSQVVSYRVSDMIWVEGNHYLHTGFGASYMPGLFAVTLAEGKFVEAQLRDTDMMEMFKSTDGQIYIYGAFYRGKSYAGVWLLEK